MDLRRVIRLASRLSLILEYRIAFGGVIRCATYGAIYPIVMDINTVRIIPIANITPSVEANIILKNCFISIEN